MQLGNVEIFGNVFGIIYSKKKKKKLHISSPLLDLDLGAGQEFGVAEADRFRGLVEAEIDPVGHVVRVARLVLEERDGVEGLLAQAHQVRAYGVVNNAVLGE